MLVYKFDEKGLFIGIDETELDPLESELQGKEIYLLPPNATFDAPEVKDGFAPVWSGEKWEHVEDNRGREYWLPEDKYGAPARTMDELGPLPDGAILTPPEQTAEEVKAQALATIDNATSGAILAGFDYEVEGESLHFSYDSFDQQNFADTANVAMMGQAGIEGVPTSVTWNAYRDYTKETGGELVRLTLDAPAFLALYTQGALGHKAAQMELGGQRKAAVAAAETIEEIKALLSDWGL